MAEPVNEKGLKNSLRVMEAPVVHGISLYRVDGTVSISIPEVFVKRQVVEEGVDDQGAQVLKEEEGAV